MIGAFCCCIVTKPLLLWSDESKFAQKDGDAGAWLRPGYSPAATTIIAASAGFDALANPSLFHLFCIDIVMTLSFLERPPLAVAPTSVAVAAGQIGYRLITPADTAAVVAMHHAAMEKAYTKLCPEFAAHITPASIGALWEGHWQQGENAWGVMAVETASNGGEKPLGIVRGQRDCTLDLQPALAPNLNPALLAQVYVAEAARGCGVGSRLVNIMLDILASTGQRQAISAVHPDNHAGQGLQTKAGGVMMPDTYKVHYDNFGVSKEVRLIQHNLTTRQPNPELLAMLRDGMMR
jgi:GNAT superfamily N-acetyltransferase